MIGKSRKCWILSLSLSLSLVFLLAGMSGPTWAASGTKTLQFSPQPASPVLTDGRWAQFAVRVLKSNGALDSTNNKSKITISLNVSSGSTGVLSGTPVTKTVKAGVATFALSGDPAISYNQAGTIALKATASDIAGYSRISNFVSVLAPFAVSSVTPVENTTNVPVTTSVTVSFNRSVDTSSVNSASFFLTPSVAGTYSFSGSTATFTPSVTLANSTAYTATVTTAAKDMNGFPLGSAKTWSFTTEAPLPPVSLEFNPQPASPVLTNSPWAQFAVRALKSDGTLDAGNNTTQITVSLNMVSGTTGVLSGTPVTKTVTAGVATFALPGDPAISYNQAGTISLKATASDIASYSRSSNSVSVLAPFALTGWGPASQATNVPVGSSVSINFNRSFDTATVNPTTFFLTPSVAGTYILSGNTATFKPTAPLAYNTTYTVNVTTAIKDLYGFPLGSAKIWSFTTPSLEFNPQPASPVVVNSPWTSFAVRVFKSDGTVDTGNNTSQITLSLNSGATGVLSGTLAKTVTAGVATFTDISYNLAGSISLKASLSDMPANSKTSNTVSVLALLSISSVSPAENAANIPSNISVAATLNRNINAATVNSTTFLLTPSVAGTYSVSGTTIRFTPSAYLANNTTYTATVTTGVKDTYGFALAAAKTWSFTTWNPAPPAWGEPVAISQGTGNYGVICSGDSSNLTAVWLQNASPQYGIFSNHLVTSGPWEGVQTVVPLSTTWVTYPTMASEAGITTALWAYGPYPYSIAASQHSNGFWTPLQNLGTGDFPDVAMGSGATAVWRASFNTINASRWDNISGNFGVPVTISNTTASNTSPPSVCQNPSTGNAVAVWNEIVSGTSNIVTNRFDGVSWGAPVTVASASNMTSVSGGLPVVCDQFGNATVAFQVVPVGGTNLVPYAARYEVNPPPPGIPGWQAPVQIGPDEGATYSTGPMTLAVDGTGAVLAVWSANNGTVFSGTLLSNRYTPGLGWDSSPKTIHSDTTTHYYPAMALDKSVVEGPAAVVWMDNVSLAVKASILNDPVNGTWGTPEIVSNPFVNYYQPQVSMDAGKVRAIWVQSTGVVYSAERP